MELLAKLIMPLKSPRNFLLNKFFSWSYTCQ